jgi:hypothetical protein
MLLYTKVLTIIFSVTFFIFFINMLSKRSIKPFYSFLWLTISLLMFSVVIFEKFYKMIATTIGITDASFLIIVSVIFFLLIYVLYLSIKISEMSDRIQELISFTAILEKKVRDDS